MTKSEWKEQALRIGQHVVSIYGAVCEDVEIDNKTGNILVYGNEYGEKFYCEVTPMEWSAYAREAGVL